MPFDPSKEITPEIVKEAAEKAGITITPNKYFEVRDGRPCGCPMTALARAYISPELEGGSGYSQDLGLTYNRHVGFLLGFDGDAPPFPGDIEGRRGYHEGTACRLALLPSEPSPT